MYACTRGKGRSVPLGARQSAGWIAETVEEQPAEPEPGRLALDEDGDPLGLPGQVGVRVAAVLLGLALRLAVLADSNLEVVQSPSHQVKFLGISCKCQRASLFTNLMAELSCLEVPSAGFRYRPSGCDLYPSNTLLETLLQSTLESRKNELLD